MATKTSYPETHSRPAASSAATTARTRRCHRVGRRVHMAGIVVVVSECWTSTCTDWCSRSGTACPLWGRWRYRTHMRRRAGTGLVRNENKILAAALRLAVGGTSQLYGYELFSQLRAWE